MGTMGLMGTMGMSDPILVMGRMGHGSHGYDGTHGFDGRVSYFFDGSGRVWVPKFVRLLTSTVNCLKINLFN